MGVGAGETGQAREIEQKSLQQLNVKLGNQVKIPSWCRGDFQLKIHNNQ